MSERTESCWVTTMIRIDDDGISTVMIVPERIMRFEGRKVITWHAPGYQLDAIVDACWRLPPGPPTEENLDEHHLEPLLSHGYLEPLEVLRLLAGSRPESPP